MKHRTEQIISCYSLCEVNALDAFRLTVVMLSRSAVCREGPTLSMNEIMTRLQDSMDSVTGIRQVITLGQEVP